MSKIYTIYAILINCLLKHLLKSFILYRPSSVSFFVPKNPISAPLCVTCQFFKFRFREARQTYLVTIGLGAIGVGIYVYVYRYVCIWILTNCGAYSIISSSSATTTGAAVIRLHSTGRVQRLTVSRAVVRSSRRRPALGVGGGCRVI